MDRSCLGAREARERGEHPDDDPERLARHGEAERQGEPLEVARARLQEVVPEERRVEVDRGDGGHAAIERSPTAVGGERQGARAQGSASPWIPNWVRIWRYVPLALTALNAVWIASVSAVFVFTTPMPVRIWPNGLPATSKVFGVFPM